MNRFSVIYLFKEQFYHIYSATHAEAEAALQQLHAEDEKEPVGIYDAKTELFYWESKRQLKYDKAPIEEQGPLGDKITVIAKNLRQLGDNQQPEEKPAPEIVTSAL